MPDPTVEDKPADFKWTEFPRFFTQKAQGSFCQRSDEMHFKRVKTTHTQGLVALVEWVPVEGNGYSGVYEEGSDAVIMRLSESNMLYDGVKGLEASVAFKFLIDGLESENVLSQ